MIRVFFYHHQSSGHSHSVLGSPVHEVSIAAPPQHRKGHVAFKHAKRLRRVRHVEAQAHAGAQVEEAMLGDPLPQHVACGPPAVLQHQVGAIHCDAAFQRFTLQDEQALFWKEVDERTKRKTMRWEEVAEGRGGMRDMGEKWRCYLNVYNGNCLRVAFLTQRNDHKTLTGYGRDYIVIAIWILVEDKNRLTRYCF